MTNPKPTIGMLKRLLGAELLRLRESTGLKQHQVAEHLGKAANKISRVETGQVGIDSADLDVLLTLYDAAEKDKVWCHHLASSSKVRRGRPTSEMTLYLGPKWFRAFRDLERGATGVLNVGSEIIPGILQTDAYIRAMFAAQGMNPTDQQINDTVRVRAERREILTRDDPPAYSFVLSESAVRRQIGRPEEMADQLRHVAEMALLPNITLQVIPFNALSYAPIRYTFTVFRFGRDMGNDIVYIELFEDAAYLDKPEVVRKYPDLFERLRGIALGPVESRNFVLELADQFAANQNAREDP